MRLHPFAGAMLAAISGAIFAQARSPVPPANWVKPSGITRGRRTTNAVGKYPEQSARQKLRGLRRAQGGPGLTEGADPQARA